MENFSCQEVEFKSDLYMESISLRDEILRKPLNLQFSAEELEQEVDSHHLVCINKGKVVGVVVLRPTNKHSFKMRQVAIKSSLQRKGIGQKLVKFSENFSIAKGIRKIKLHARITAMPFYIKLGYQKIGKEFEEVGIKHFKMEKILIPINS